MKKKPFIDVSLGSLSAAFVAGIFGAVLYVHAIMPPQATPAMLPAQQLAEPSELPQEVDVEEGTHTLGSDDAPVRIVEFSDFECPFCARFHEGTLPLLKERYIDTGLVHFSYRHLPLEFIHASARGAAIASECAAQQQQFWPYHDVLFEDISRWSGGGEPALVAIAAEIGLNESAFSACIKDDSGELGDIVDRDLAAAESAGISGTPSFSVNGQVISGAQPFAAFASIIDAELEK